MYSTTARFEKTDWRTDQPDPYIGPNAVWMGNDSRNYSVHIVGLTLNYHLGN